MSDVNLTQWIRKLLPSGLDAVLTEIVLKGKDAISPQSNLPIFSTPFLPQFSPCCGVYSLPSPLWSLILVSDPSLCPPVASSVLQGQHLAWPGRGALHQKLFQVTDWAFSARMDVFAEWKDDLSLPNTQRANHSVLAPLRKVNGELAS